eukprot:m.221025 g.221025  ORF g.221025 m.221025 type:complete len:156 (-) comp15700_c0_seq1:139-606(-)
MSDLQWAIIRRNNALIFKNRLGARAVFSKEANNLTAQHSRKFSGLVNSKTVGIVGDGDHGVVVSLKAPKRTSAPKTAYNTVTLKSGARPTMAAIKNLVSGGQPDYRADLTKFALARASAILLSQKKKTPKVKKGRKAKKVKKAVKKVAAPAATKA